MMMKPILLKRYTKAIKDPLAI